MKSAAIVLFGLLLTAQPKEGVPGQPADILADLTQRFRASMEKIQRPATRVQAERVAATLRAKLKHAIGLHRVSQTVRVSLFPPAPSNLPVPALILLTPECASKATAYAQHGFLVACTEETGLPNTPDLLAGITPQARTKNGVARTLQFLLEQPSVDRSRVMLVGEGPAATLAAGLFPEFARIALTNPGIGDSLVYGIARLAETRDIVALAAPRALLLNGAAPSLVDVTLDHYRRRKPTLSGYGSDRVASAKCPPGGTASAANRRASQRTRDARC
jgi:hypothetical protein